MSSDEDIPKIKPAGSKHDSMISSIVNMEGGQQNLQVLNDRKVLLLYASGAAAAEGELNESHMTVVKGRLEQRLKNISFLCDLEYKYIIINLYTLKYSYYQTLNLTVFNKSYFKVQINNQIFHQYHSQDGCLATPISEYGRRTVYKVMELEQITNSRQTSYADTMDFQLFFLNLNKQNLNLRKINNLTLLDTLQKSLRRTMKNIVLLLF